MIDWKKSAEMNKMSVDDLKACFKRFLHSNRNVWRICDVCDEGKSVMWDGHGDLCIKCANQMEERREEQTRTMTGEGNPNFGCKTSEKTLGLQRAVKLGKNNPMYGQPRSAKDRKAISDATMGHDVSQNTRDAVSKAQKNRAKPKEERIRISCGMQGIPVEEFNGFAEDKYCYKFNEPCREHNREKYDRKCFLCGKLESENGRKLSVHHIDGNKDQGCNGHDWKLTPLCGVCHGLTQGKANLDLWYARIIYLFKHVWDVSHPLNRTIK